MLRVYRWKCSPSRVKPPSLFKIRLDCCWKPSLVFNRTPPLYCCILPNSILSLEHHPNSIDIDSRSISIGFHWTSAVLFRFFLPPAGCVRFEDEGQGCAYSVQGTQFAKHCRSETSRPRFFCRRIQWGFLIFVIYRAGWHYSISFLLSPPLSTALIRIYVSLCLSVSEQLTKNRKE